MRPPPCSCLCPLLPQKEVIQRGALTPALAGANGCEWLPQTRSLSGASWSGPCCVPKRCVRPGSPGCWPIQPGERPAAARPLLANSVRNLHVLTGLWSVLIFWCRLVTFALLGLSAASLVGIGLWSWRRLNSVLARI